MSRHAHGLRLALGGAWLLTLGAAVVLGATGRATAAAIVALAGGGSALLYLILDAPERYRRVFRTQRATQRRAERAQPTRSPRRAVAQPYGLAPPGARRERRYQ